MRAGIKAGVSVTFQGKALSAATDNDVLIETSFGPVKIPISMIVSVDVQEVIEGSPVTSTLANRKDLYGIVKAIDGDNAWVHWHSQRFSTEKLNTLRLHHMSPV